MGRPLKRRGSQKTCPNSSFAFEDRGRLADLEDKKRVIPGSR
jgi:hypothetical protein